MRRWHHTESYSICMGWDRPLQYFFCEVYPKTENMNDLPEPLYHNLDDAPESFNMKSLLPYQAMLQEKFAVTLPEEFVQTLVEDQSKHFGAAFMTPSLQEILDTLTRNHHEPSEKPD
jgi:hypothetical protein